MKRAASCLLILLTVSGTTACLQRPKRADDSSSASLKVGTFEPKEGMPAWSDLHIVFTPSGQAKEISRRLARSETAEHVDALTIPFGVYRIKLNYFGTDGKTIVYRECEAERKKTHEIMKTDYQAAIRICRTNALAESNASAGQPFAAIKIIPELAAEPQ